jgi:acetyl esterase/lipase
MTRRGLMLAASTLTGALASACSPLTAFNTLAPRDAAAKPGRDIAYGSDPRQKLDVYTPVGGVSSAPVVVFFYGGGWDSGRRQDYAFAGQALAAQGFVAVVPDYRLVPQVRYPDFLSDGAAAIAWARDHVSVYGGDPTRITVAGHSAGAYNAMMLALDPKYLQAAGVDPHIIRAAAGLSGPYDFLPFRVKSTLDTFGQAPDPAATQPINHVTAAAPPIFLAHGDKDDTVYPKNTLALAAALTQAGDTVEVKIYPGLSHVDVVLALSRMFRGKAPVLADMAAFLKAHAG